jgi:hypothetical protein
MNPAPSKLQPALYGGLFIGVLSGLPLISAGNCCCCLWVIGGGVLTAYLIQQNQPTPIRAEDGALGGLLAGAIGGVLAALISIPIAMLLGPVQQQFFESIAANPDLPEQYREILGNMGKGGALGGLFGVAAALVNVVVYSIFAMLGGLLGVALFKKKDLPPPPGTIDVLPSL